MIRNGAVVSEPYTRATTADRWTFAFYGAAAVTSLVGQVWAGADHIPGDLPFAAKAIIISVPVLVIELFGVAMAARADMRMRAGHSGVRYQVLSATAATFAVVFNFAGHYEQGLPSWWSWLFGGLSAGAYVVWLFHAADRRNDAAEARQHRAAAAPDYGLWRRITQRDRVRLATELAQEHGLGLFDSLRAADEQIRTDNRRRLIGRVLRDIIRAEHDDRRMADLAEVSVDIDKLAVDIESRVDYAALSDRIAAKMNPVEQPKLTTRKPAVSRDLTGGDSAGDGDRKPGPKPSPQRPRREPSTGDKIVAYLRRWPDKTPAEVAAKLGVSERTVQRHRPAADDDTAPMALTPALA